VVGLPLNERGDGFSVAGAEILIDGHSETTGQAKDPQRFLVNMFVEDLAAEQARLEAQGVEFIRKQGREYWGGIISTFLDPDGNYAQILEYRPG
jgi:predicted enzyme related to lactoylglutathione lyase